MEEKGITADDDDDSISASAIVVRSMFEKHASAIQAYLKLEGVQCKTQKSIEVNNDLGFPLGILLEKKSV